MSNHRASLNGGPPVPFITTPAFPPGRLPSFNMTFNPSCLAPAHAPTAVISIRHRQKYFLLRPMPEWTHVEAFTSITPPKRFPVPLSLLLLPSLWQQTASGMLSHFDFSSDAHALLLSHLHNLAACWAEVALRFGCTSLDVTLDVDEGSEVQYTPLVPSTLMNPESMSPAEEVSVDQEMKLREPSEIAPGETCAVCLEEFRGSTKVVTETPCSHLFHTDCFLPWLSRATTCPLCRSSLRLHDQVQS